MSEGSQTKYGRIVYNHYDRLFFFLWHHGAFEHTGTKFFYIGMQMVEATERYSVKRCEASFFHRFALVNSRTIWPLRITHRFNVASLALCIRANGNGANDDTFQPRRAYYECVLHTYNTRFHRYSRGFVIPRPIKMLLNVNESEYV